MPDRLVIINVYSTFSQLKQLSTLGGLIMDNTVTQDVEVLWTARKVKEELALPHSSVYALLRRNNIEPVAYGLYRKTDIITLKNNSIKARYIVEA
jgi:hypothetical protein